MIAAMAQIIKMHEKFNLTPEQVQWTEEEKQFRIKAMLEEISEFKESETREDQLDALVDLVVFALGTAYRMDFYDVFDIAFIRVMKSNRMKEVGANHNKSETRGAFHIDLVKPEGWQAADLSDLV